MRTIILLLFAFLLTSSLAPVQADGIYVPKIDPNSRTQDLYEPEQKAVIVRINGIEKLTLQVSYKGNVQEFAWLVPTPSRPEVSEAYDEVFEELHEATATRYRYWFDADKKLHDMQRHRGVKKNRTADKLDVDVVERKQLGIYDISVLRAGDERDLIKWLRSNGYRVTPKLEKVFADYIRRKWIFTAMRVNTGSEKAAEKQMSEGVLQALDFTFPTPKPVYPLLVSSLNPGKTNILLYVYTDHRVEADPLHTVCVLDSRRGIQGTSRNLAAFLPHGMPDKGPWHSKRFLTKLTGNLGPNQMTHDLFLRQAKTDKTIPRPTTPPPFLENLGALVLLAMLALTMPPYGLIMSVVCLAGTGVRMIRHRPTPWYAIGIAAPFLSLPVLIIIEISESYSFWPAGLAMLVAVGIIMGAKIKKKNSDSPE